jgi:hypothetical protein
MCLTDWDYHVDGDSRGCRVYPTEADLRRERACAAECGVAKITMTFEAVVQEPTYG